MAERRARSGEGASLVASLVIIGLIAIGVGVLMGNYAIKMFTRPPSEPNPSTIAEDVASKAGKDLGAGTGEAGSSASGEGTTPGAAIGQEAGRVTSGTVGSMFRVQVGAFQEKENAEKLKEELARQGYEAVVSATAPYRVQVGAFVNEENAKRVAEELESKGYPVYIPKD